MNCYKFTISYIGTKYHGWQSQPSGMGIQNHVENALSTALREKVIVRGASRTDSGVHAECQVATFLTEWAGDLERLHIALNGILPGDIIINDLILLDYKFHPIRNCLGKTYRYRIWNGKKVNPFVAPYCYQVYETIDMKVLKDCLQLLKGRHDFTSFCAKDSSAKTKIRNITDVAIEEFGPLINIWVQGEGFLKQMIRIIVGTCVRLSIKQGTTDDMQKILDAHERTLAYRTATAKGLSLVELHYNELPSLASVIDKSNQGFKISTITL